MKTGFYYVYILLSERVPPHFYTGFTEDLEARLVHHNAVVAKQRRRARHVP